MNRYAVSDLHGQLELYNQIKEYVQSDDIIYALGDFGDRGPEPWLTLKAALDDSQLIYLMGNHDLMLIEAIEQNLHYIANYERETNEKWDWEDGDPPFIPRGATDLLRCNGGFETFVGWYYEPDRMKYLQKLKALPFEIVIPDKDCKHMIHLCHAGYTPSLYYPTSADDYVWDRDHFNYFWENFDDLLIHGHTPIQYLEDFVDKRTYVEDFKIKDGYCIYNEGRKIDIDRCAQAFGETVLLNLDTLEGKIFRTKEAADRLAEFFPKKS